MNPVFDSPMFYVIVVAWAISFFYLRSMKRYEKEGSFVGSFEPKLLFFVTTVVFIVSVFIGVSKSG